MLSRIRSAVRREEGASAVEYGLLIAAIAAVIIVAVFALGRTVNQKFTDVNTSISSGGK